MPIACLAVLNHGLCRSATLAVRSASSLSVKTFVRVTQLFVGGLKTFTDFRQVLQRLLRSTAMSFASDCVLYVLRREVSFSSKVHYEASHTLQGAGLSHTRVQCLLPKNAPCMGKPSLLPDSRSRPIRPKDTSTQTLIDPLPDAPNHHCTSPDLHIQRIPIGQLCVNQGPG